MAAEGTSNLDVENEQLILEALEQLRGCDSVLLITNRLAAIRMPI